MTYQDLKQALFAREVASAYYLHNPRVTLIDVGLQIKGGIYTGDLAVRVHVRNKIAEPALELLGADCPGLVIDKTRIPFLVDIIEGNYPLHYFWGVWPPDDPRFTACDPLRGGISVSGEWLFGSGTLGGFVEDRDTHEKMILSNWHVLAGSDYGVPGTRIFQPGYGDGDGGGNTIATLTRHSFAQGIDAAVATLNDARAWTNDQMGIGAVTGVKQPGLHMKVIKSGRTTGVTYGVVDGFEGEFPVSYNGVPHSIKYVYRIVPQPGKPEVSQPGDSGSWWLEEDTRQAVGLHFAGQDDPEIALAMSMPQVLDALNVNIITAPRELPAPVTTVPTTPFDSGAGAVVETEKILVAVSG